MNAGESFTDTVREFLSLKEATISWYRRGETRCDTAALTGGSLVMIIAGVDLGHGEISTGMATAALGAGAIYAGVKMRDFIHEYVAEQAQLTEVAPETGI